MKTYVFLICIILFSLKSGAQTIAPCEKWITDFVRVEPKLSNGNDIDKYVLSKLEGDTSLKRMAGCMVGLRIYSNCNGELSFEKQPYINDEQLTSQCLILQHKLERIMKEVKSLNPARTAGKNRDFIFKLVVKIKRNGKPVTEILYYS
jgi:hypothetical protein